METTTRMGSRSSSRHGPAVQFSGRVRKWQKTWTKSETSEKLQVYKWLPKSGDREDEQEELPARKYRYLPLDIVQSQARGETAMDVTEPKDAPGADAPNAAMETPNAPATQAPGEEKTGVNRPVAAFLEVAQADTVEDSALAKQPGEERQGDASTQQDEHTADERGDVEPTGAETAEKTEGGLVAEGGEREHLRRTGDSNAELAGTTTAGVIEDALIETGLVAEGEAAGVEAKALARIVALDEMERREAGAVDATKQEADQQGEQGTLGATKIDEVGSREEEAPNEGKAVVDDGRETEKETDPLEEKAESTQSKDPEPGPANEEGKDG